jgi:hypothetical protein
MNKFNAHNTGEDTASGAYGESPSSIRRQRAAGYGDRLVELEMENSRLHRLVAELLIKNQQLRKSD